MFLNQGEKDGHGFSVEVFEVEDGITGTQKGFVKKRRCY